MKNYVFILLTVFSTVIIFSCSSNNSDKNYINIKDSVSEKFDAVVDDSELLIYTKSNGKGTCSVKTGYGPTHTSNTSCAVCISNAQTAGNASFSWTSNSNGTVVSGSVSGANGSSIRIDCGRCQVIVR